MNNLEFLRKEFLEQFNYWSSLVEKHKDDCFCIHEKGYEEGQLAFSRYALSVVENLIKLENE